MCHPGAEAATDDDADNSINNIAGVGAAVALVVAVALGLCHLETTRRKYQHRRSVRREPTVRLRRTVAVRSEQAVRVWKQSAAVIQ